MKRCWTQVKTGMSSDGSPRVSMRSFVVGVCYTESQGDLVSDLGLQPNLDPNTGPKKIVLSRH